MLPLSVLNAFANTTNELFVRDSKENRALIFVQMTQRLEKTSVYLPNRVCSDFCRFVRFFITYRERLVRLARAYVDTFLLYVSAGK